jgi:hypothetical protein
VFFFTELFTEVFSKKMASAGPAVAAMILATQPQRCI